MKKQQKSGGSRKIGRNKIKCDRYKAQNRRLINKAKKIKRHLKTHSNDLQSANFLAKIQ